MIEIASLEGPLDDERIQWVADLYGEVDPKYRERAQLEHLFRDNPFAASLHAFALDGARPVGHCAVVPIAGREGSRALLTGKVEALVVVEPYRGRRPDSPPVAVALREALYAKADTAGVELLHAYVRPEVARILELEPLHVALPSFVGVVRPTGLKSWRRLPATAAWLAQTPPRAMAQAVVRRGDATVRAPTVDDRDLVHMPSPPEGRWTVLADDTWHWYCRAPALRLVELDGANGSRTLVQMPSAPGDALRVAAWSSTRPTLRSALRALTAVTSLASRVGAGTLRYQPWADDEAGAALSRACRLLGCVRRDDFGTLYVRARRSELARSDRVVATPLFGLGF